MSGKPDDAPQNSYEAEKATLKLTQNGMYTECVQDVSKVDTQVSIGKVIDRDRLELDMMSGKPDDAPQNSKVSIEKKDKHSEERKQIIDYLNTRLGSKYTYTSQANNRHINARLDEGHTVADFKTVIDKKFKSWHSDPTMCIYLRPETLFGNKFDGYLNEPEAPKTYERIKSEEFDYAEWERTHDEFGNPIEGGTS